MTLQPSLAGCLVAILAAFHPATSSAQFPAAQKPAAPPTPTPSPTPAPTEADPKAGHSLHGAAFDEGPRQIAAGFLAGQGAVHFPVTTPIPTVQVLFDQGVAQLHSFFYWEAERSFRTAAAIDPNCAMLYWGMAMANTNNAARAKGFIEQAEWRKGLASPRERMWIDALSAYHKAGDKDGGRVRNYVRALEAIIAEYPDDPEPRAFLALTLWERQDKNPINSHQAVDSLIADVLRLSPMHPGAHHARIHLWDSGDKPARALPAAELYGPAAPGIAHAWHMPGHIYSKLRRYLEAAWSQEASARVDHAYMARERTMPYLIHNYAHNNQWLVTTLSHLGRVRDGSELARNLIEIPRHPKWNKIADGGSAARDGRNRLMEILGRHEMWDDLAAAADTWLAPLEGNGFEDDAVRRLRAVGSAHIMRGDASRGRAALAELETMLAKAVPPDTSKLPPAAARTVDFAKDVRPLLVGRCFECHAGSAATSGRRLDRREDILGGEGGRPFAVAGDGAGSRLVHVVAGLVEGHAMPPKGPRLSAEEIGLLRAWIDQGLPWEGEKPLPTKPPEKPAEKEKADKTAKTDKKDKPGKPKTDEARAAPIRNAIEELRGRMAAVAGDHKATLEHFKKAGELRKETLARAYLATGDKENAEKTAREAVEKAPDQVAPAAALAEVLFRVGKADAAREAMRKLGDLAGQADADLPALRRLAPVAEALKLPAGWRKPVAVKVDAHHPPLDSLGPFRWTPPAAPPLAATDADGLTVTLAGLLADGRPTLVLFHLGHGCPHCLEQLRKFLPAAGDFESRGIRLVAVGRESRDALRRGTEREKPPVGVVMLADEDGAAFRAWRVHDDFEDRPLHGAFLLDGAGRIRWMDTGPDPFLDVKLLLAESSRLLSLPSPSAPPSAAGSAPTGAVRR